MGMHSQAACVCTYKTKLIDNLGRAGMMQCHGKPYMSHWDNIRFKTRNKFSGLAAHLGSEDACPEHPVAPVRCRLAI